MKKKNKKGQTEDIFADLLIAIILIVIAVIIIGAKKGEHLTSTNSILSSEKNELKEIDLLTLLRSPAFQHNVEAEGLSKIETFNFAELFSAIASNYPNENMEYSWLFDDLIDEGLTCESELNELIAETLGYSNWNLYLYRNQGKKVFECENIVQKDYAMAQGYYAEFNTTIPTQDNRQLVVQMEVVE